MDGGGGEDAAWIMLYCSALEKILKKILFLTFFFLTHSNVPWTKIGIRLQCIPNPVPSSFCTDSQSQDGETDGGFTKGILRGVRCTKSLRVLFLHRRPPSWTTLVLYSRAAFIFNEPALKI
jgi:hypothetical protein